MNKTQSNRFDGMASGAGKQTLLKTNFRSQVDLVSITDQKANILLGFNTIIISIFVTYDQKISILPMLSLLITCVVSGMYALIAVWPKAIQKQLDDQLGVLLLARNYRQIDEYLDQISKILKSNELIYRNIATDLHTIGSLLVYKNSLLRKAYFVFFMGIVLSVFLFLLGFSGIV